MTENEAKTFLEIEKQCINRNCDRNCAQCDIVQKVENLNSAYDAAIKALEEVQQYRKHGVTVESALNNMCDLTAAENLLEEYRVIGTPEECQAAVEKQTARKGIREKIKKGYNRGKHHYYCPVCYEKGDLRNKYNVGLYCSDCGQKLDWGDEE